MARLPYAPAPFTAPISGDINQRLTAIAEAINRKADATASPAFNSIVLRAPDGSNWQLSVNASGAVITTQVMT